MWRWTAAGLAISLVPMFAKTEFMAESGSHPDDLWSYAFWIPIVGGLSLLCALGSGVLFGSAVALLQRIESTSAMPRGRMGAWCGALGGVVPSAIFLFDRQAFAVALAIFIVLGTLGGWLLRNHLD